MEAMPARKHLTWARRGQVVLPTEKKTSSFKKGEDCAQAQPRTQLQRAPQES